MILTAWTSRENSLELTKLYSIDKVSLVSMSSGSDTGSVRERERDMILTRSLRRTV